MLDSARPGRVPRSGLVRFRPAVAASDQEAIGQPLDSYGVNVYGGRTVAAAADGGWSPVAEAPGPEGDGVAGDTRGPLRGARLHERYRLPIVVTESGMANCDWVADDGPSTTRSGSTTCAPTAARRPTASVPRPLRPVDPRHSEWSFGHRRRFGIACVDYPTQARIPKDSARCYGRVIATNGAALDEVGSA